MTTMPLVSGGGATPTLPEPPATHLDTQHALWATRSAPATPRSAAATAATCSRCWPHRTTCTRWRSSNNRWPTSAPAAPATRPAPRRPRTRLVPDAATRTYDVATTSQADIDALKNSPDPKQQRLGHTIENAKAAYGDLLDKDIKIAAALNAGNGGEPVLTITSEKFKYTAAHARAHPLPRRQRHRGRPRGLQGRAELAHPRERWRATRRWCSYCPSAATPRRRPTAPRTTTTTTPTGAT